MKKLIPLFLAGTLLLGAAGCSNTNGGGTSSTPPASEKPSAPVESKTSEGGASATGDYADVKIAVMLSGPPTDGGYCQQGADGLRAIQAKYGMPDENATILDTITTAETAKSEAANLAEEGYKIVFGQGGEFAEYFKEIAPDYPDTWFVTNGGNVTSANQFPMCMSTEEGGYVCGVIAGMMSKSKNVGVIAGGDYPSFTKPGVGFAVGVKSVDDSITVKQAVLTATNANEAYETAMNQIQSGADFIFPNANEGTTGAIKAVDESEGAYGFGVFGNYIPNSPTKVVGNSLTDAPGAYVAVFDAIMSGNATGDIMFLGMKDGIISFQWNEDVKATLPAEVVEAAEKAIEDIKAGKVTIPNEYEIGENGYQAYFQ